MWRARRALDRGDLDQARALVGPLLERFGSVTLVRKVAGEVLYASGDPRSAASLLERVAKKLPGDRAVAIGLVASYAALGHVGDARRSAALAPGHVDVRLALAWCELTARDGDAEAGRHLVAGLARDPNLEGSAERLAMHAALEAIVAARAGDIGTTRAKLESATGRTGSVRPSDRAFVGYLEGVALREAGLVDQARVAFTGAIVASDGSIGAALARRERANLR